MKIITILLLILPAFVFSQLNVKQFGAKGDGKTNDQHAIQAAIDSAVKSGGIVYIPKGNYRIDQPLLVYNWNGKRYAQAFCKIMGESTMWDNGNGSVITANFKDKFALGIQLGKGVIIKGITIQGLYSSPKLSKQDFFNADLDRYGDLTCRDTRFSPYAGIVIDPFGFEPIEGDNGYPGMRSWYRGPKTNSGSTGVRIDDVTISNFTIGILVSPNGYTRNAELLTFENIRFGDGKIGFVGCQDQEKMNRIINVGCWSRMHTLFVWNKYGSQRPGNYYIEGVNIAGAMNQLIYRVSLGWFPMFMTNVFAESLGKIGTWETLLSDKLSNSSLNFEFPEEMGNYPDNHLFGSGLTIDGCTIRYYGRLNEPILFDGNPKIINSSFYRSPITGISFPDYSKKQGATIRNLGEQKITGIKDKKLVISNLDKGLLQKGKVIVFMNSKNWKFMGLGKVDSVWKQGCRVVHISPNIKSQTSYGLGVYE